MICQLNLGFVTSIPLGFVNISHLRLPTEIPPEANELVEATRRIRR
jgi:hypothetical protein